MLLRKLTFLHRVSLRQALGAVFLLSCCTHAQSCLTLYDPMACSLPDSSVHGIFQAWSGMPFPTPGDLPNPGIKPTALCLLYWQARSFPLTPPGKSSCSAVPKRLWKLSWKSPCACLLCAARVLLFCSYSNWLFTCFRAYSCLPLTHVWKTLFPKLLLFVFFFHSRNLFIYFLNPVFVFSWVTGCLIIHSWPLGDFLGLCRHTSTSPVWGGRFTFLFPVFILPFVLLT